MAQAQSGRKEQSTLDFDYNEDEQKKIVKIQANIRGRQTRKTVQFKKEFGGIDSMKHKLIAYLVDEPGLEFKQDIIFENGTQYKGQVRNGTIRHGYGVQVWPDGARYEGFWKDGVAHGRGKFYHIDGDIYEGIILFKFINLIRQLGKRQSKWIWSLHSYQWIKV